MILCVACAAFAQKKDVPPLIQSEFAKKAPGSGHVKWEKEDSAYEAHYQQNGSERSMTFDMQGNLLETETAIPITELPVPAQQYATARGRIKEASRIVKTGGTVIYEAEVGKRDLLFDKNGDYLK